MSRRSCMAGFGGLVLGLWALPAQAWELRDGEIHVVAGESIQEGLDEAARSEKHKVVKVHPGTYRPRRHGQALIWLHRQHDGIRLEAVGNVILTAANPDVSEPDRPSHPAIVNHVVYFGDGISSRTQMIGFKVTGARDLFYTNRVEEVEPNARLEKGLFFFCDGGGVKVFGRSYPVIRGVEVYGNYASPCAGGVSVEHDGHGPGTAPTPVRFIDCIFRNNTAQINGAAVDLLPGSNAVLTNCLFLRNAGNLGENYIDPRPQKEFTNAAVLCVFPDARAVVRNCTFVGNRNAVHDQGSQSVYARNIFWNNNLPGGFYTDARYEMWIEGRAQVAECFFNGPVRDPNGSVPETTNFFNPPDPELDAFYIPRKAAYARVGYRPPETRVLSGR